MEKARASRRLARERETIRTMISIFCRAHHNACAKPLCSDCQALMDYASLRLDRCRFGPLKPTCVNCPVHCYQATRREQVRAVMRFSGPRMMWRHPLPTLWHFIDGYRKAPDLVAQVQRAPS